MTTLTNDLELDDDAISALKALCKETGYQLKTGHVVRAT
jgi:hypothetical protein